MVSTNYLTYSQWVLGLLTPLKMSYDAAKEAGRALYQDRRRTPIGDRLSAKAAPPL